MVDCELTGEELLGRIAPRDDLLVLEAPEPEPEPEPEPQPGRGAGAESSKPLHPTERTGEPASAGRLVYRAADGPFRHYRRTIEWSSLDEGRFRFHQEVTFRASLSVFSPLYHPLMRRALRRPLPAGAHPWWMLPDRLSARQAQVIAVMCIFNVVGGMLYAFLTNVLTFASADLGTGSAGEQSLVFVVTRVGTVLTIVVMATADRIGRRRVAIWSAVAAALITVACALAPSLWVLTALQTVSRNLAIAAMLAADTLSVEEVPAGSRAAAQGLGALSYGLGAGTVVLSLPLADLGPAGWRLVFAVALLTLPLIWIAARNLPESARFLALAEPGSGPEPGRGATGNRRPRVMLRRLVLVGALFFLVNMIVAPSSQLQNDYLRADRGFDGARITLFVVLTGVPGFIGILIGGRWADRRGRRGVILTGLISAAIFTAGFFRFSGAPMWASATLGAVLATVSVPAMGVLAPELFPTARRGAARGTLNAVATGGSVVGLLAAGAMVDRLGYGTAFTLLALAPLTAALVSLAVPETAGRELEDLNERRPDRRDGPTSAPPPPRPPGPGP